MSYVSVGHCSRCGAPLYAPMAWGSILPPPTMRSCSCDKFFNGYTPKKYFNTGNLEIRFPNKEKLNNWVEKCLIQQEVTDTFNGVPVVIDPTLPENKAMIVSDNGEVKVFEI